LTSLCLASDLPIRKANQPVSHRRPMQKGRHPETSKRGDLFAGTLARRFFEIEGEGFRRLKGTIGEKGTPRRLGRDSYQRFLEKRYRPPRKEGRKAKEGGHEKGDPSARDTRQVPSRFRRGATQWEWRELSVQRFGGRFRPSMP